MPFSRNGGEEKENYFHKQDSACYACYGYLLLMDRVKLALWLFVVQMTECKNFPSEQKTRKTGPSCNSTSFIFSPRRCTTPNNNVQVLY